MVRTNLNMMIISMFLVVFFVCQFNAGVAHAANATRTTRVSSAAELSKALANAQPGDRIVLAANTTFSGVFKGKVDGTATAHIILESEDPVNKSTLKGYGTGTGYALTILGDYWIVKNVKIQNAQKGLMLDNANHTLIDGVEVFNIGMEAIHFRDGSSHNILQNSQIYNTGIVNPGYGEGVYVGSDKGKWNTYAPSADHNTIRNNVIGPNVRAEHIDIKEGTTGTIVSGNIFYGAGISGVNYADSFIDVKGNDVKVDGNTGYRDNNTNIKDAFQLHQQLPSWGINAEFNNNSVYLDEPTGYVVNAANGTTAKAYNNKRSPLGNMYMGNVTTD
ncbi:right-handed parallel beta-helix repeat-containing protein [Thermoflavimicrobium daqui]|uniref:Sheath polysaccharide-degrading enzyme n=1 Tax=Thermoflavimicrobium daqui TaxID=2137476 RepID=A0A364K0U8_9BACL|nr:right-handed parallel beta-helix repeat-containing protein [Thermoflavimicrobium daqui]RAL21050.1 sheath polysaccharide-degrading enzyme [Thermoflavimicrobium daqui]